MNRLAEAWVTEPSLESCESPELSMKEECGGLLMAKKGEWKLVRPTLSHPPAGPSWPQGAGSLVWRRDSWERHRQQPVLSSTLRSGPGAHGTRRLISDDDLKTGQCQCKSEEDSLLGAGGGLGGAMVPSCSPVTRTLNLVPRAVVAAGAGKELTVAS